MNKLSHWTLLISIALYSYAHSSPFTFETVAAYGESHEKAIRWADGTVRIWDGTGLLDKHPQILPMLNKNLGDVNLERTNFRKVSQVQIEWVDTLPAPHSTGCALATNRLVNDHQQIGESIVRIRRNNPCLGPTEGAALLIHELGHVLGFATHPKEGDIMSIHDHSFEKEEVSMGVLQHFLKGLYSLPVGGVIPRNELMPLPDHNSLMWRTSTNPAPPITVRQKQNVELPITQSAQPKIVFPNIPMRKITRQTERGETWEFVPIEQSNSVIQPTESSRFETIIPGRPIIRSNLDVITPRTTPNTTN